MLLATVTRASQIEPAMQDFQFPIAFHLPEFLLRFEQPPGGPAQRVIAGRPRFTLRATRSTVERQDSVGFVEDSVRRGKQSTPSRCTVSVSSHPSSRLCAALGLTHSRWRKSFSISAYRPL